MKCPECNSDSLAMETRTRQDGVKRRRYVCLSNNHKFTTLEAIVDDSETQLRQKPKAVKTRGRAGLSALWFAKTQEKS